MSRPEFPIRIRFLEDGSEWILDNEIELANNLEWFNSDDPEEKAIVTDKQGRAVSLKVEELRIETFELK